MNIFKNENCTHTRLEILESANKYLKKYLQRIIDYETTKRILKIKKENPISSNENRKNIVYKGLDRGQDFALWLIVRNDLCKGTVLLTKDKNDNIHHGILMDVGVIKAWDGRKSSFVFYEGIQSWVCTLKEEYCDQWTTLDNVIIPNFASRNGETTVLCDLPCVIENCNDKGPVNIENNIMDDIGNFYIDEEISSEDKELPNLFGNNSPTNLSIIEGLNEYKPPYMTSAPNDIEMSIFEQINKEKEERERNFHEKIGRVYNGAMEEARKELEMNLNNRENGTSKRKLGNAYMEAVENLNNCANINPKKMKK